MIALLLIIIIGLILFVIANMNNNNVASNSGINTATGFYSQNEPLDKQIIKSHFILAARMNCLPDQVKQKFLKEFIVQNFTREEAIELCRKMILIREAEAIEYGIAPQITPAGITENWLRTYIIENY